MFITGRPSNLDPPVIIILPLNILCPRTPPFALQILRFCVLAHFCRKQVAGLEGHLELIVDGFEHVFSVFLFLVHLSGSPRWGFLCWNILQWGHVFFAGASLLSFFFSSPFCCVPWLVCLSCSRVHMVCIPPPTIFVGGGAVRQFGVLRVGVITIHH
jgi:hypothetical protein